MHYLKPSPNGRNVLGVRAQLGYVQGYGGDVAPPNNRFYAGGEDDLRGFDVRSATPYGYVPTRINFQLTNPDGTCVPRDPIESAANQCIQVPLPIYGIASIGGDTSLTTNLEYRIPVVGPFTFSFFDDFGLDVATNNGQLKQSPKALPRYRAALRLPGLQQRLLPGRHPRLEVGFQQDIRPVAGTNFVPRMSIGAELRRHHADHQRAVPPLLRLQPAAPLRAAFCNERELGGKVQSCSAELITRDMFPPGGAGDFTYGKPSRPTARSTSSASPARPSG